MRNKFTVESKPGMGRGARRWLLRLIGLGLAGGVVVLVKPDLIGDEAKRAQVEQIRERVLQANIEGQEKALQVWGDTVQVGGEVMEKVTWATQEVTHQDPEAIINQAVTNISNEVKDLPKEQVKKIKVQICQEMLKDVP